VQPVGTAIEAETIGDERLAAFGRSAVAASGCVGLMNMDILRDQDGVDWLIDFNPRVFGGCTNFLLADLNVAQGYLRTVGMRSSPPESSQLVSGIRLRIFPNSLSKRVLTGSFRQAVLGFLHESRPYLKRLGLRYWVAEAMATVVWVSMIRRTRSASHDSTKDEMH